MENWTYIKNNNNTVRFTLGKIGKRNLFVIGINPSTAEPNKLDNTVTKVEKFASNNGYDGWIMLNVYPQRATDPKYIHKEVDTIIHNENLKQLVLLIQSNPNFDIWAGWGTLINKRPFLKNCLKEVAEVLGLDRNWVHLNELTKYGHPRHPLYLPYSSEFKKFDIVNYLKN
ncbi:MAG: DUF1643 domain-containing protein [Flavobacterium sp.]|jgi:hypothetical protein